MSIENLENIPLQPSIDQSFQLTYNNVMYTFTLRYSNYADYWFLDIVETNTGTPVIYGLKMIVNNNSFKGYDYLKFGKLALLDTDPTNETAVDAYYDLGTRLKLYRVT